MHTYPQTHHRHFAKTLVTVFGVEKKNIFSRHIAKIKYYVHRWAEERTAEQQRVE